MENRTFGQYIRENRTNLNMKSRRLALNARVDIGTVSRIETGRTRASLVTAIRLLKALEIQPTRFLTEYANINVEQLSSPVARASILEGGTLLTTGDLAKMRDRQAHLYGWIAATLMKVGTHRFGIGSWHVETTTEIVKSRYETGFPFEWSTIPYPEAIPAAQLHHIYLGQGVVIPIDAQMFAARLPESIVIESVDRFGLEEALEVVELAESPLSRDMFQLFWQAFSYRDSVWLNPNPDRQEVRLIEEVVLAYRWVESLNDPTLLSERAAHLRSIIASA